MEDKFLCFNTGLCLIFILIIAPIIGTAISFSVTYNYLFFLLLIISAAGTFIIIKSRKTLFSKILINEKGIARVYKTDVIKSLLWADLKIVRVVPNYHIIFLDENITQVDANKNWKTNIIFSLNKKKIKIINKYKNYFENKLMDTSILGKVDRDLLLD